MYFKIVASFLWSIFLIKYSDFLCAPCFVLSSPSTTPLKTHQHTKTSQTDIGDQLPLSSQMAEVRKGEEETELQATAHLKRNVTPTLQGVPDIMLDTEPLTTQLIETGLEENPFKPELCACLCVWRLGGVSLKIFQSELPVWSESRQSCEKRDSNQTL